MAAALIDTDDVPQVRDAMLTAQLSNETKTHWHGSNPLRRLQLARVAAALPLTAIVISHNQEAASDRRHRRKCLESLLPLIANLDCATLTLESLGGQDQSDLDLLRRFRSQKLLAGSFTLRHAIGRDEPALWVADIICGAVTQNRIGASVYLDVLASSIDIVHLQE